MDIDLVCVATTQAMLNHHTPWGAAFRVEEISVFDLHPEAMGPFDTVYSWDVLTQATRSAPCAAPRPWLGQQDGWCLPCTANMDGEYGRIWMDAFWRKEKCW